MDGKERRRHPRYSLPMLIEAPALSSQPIEAVNVSAGGLMIVLTRKPELRAEYPFSLRIAGLDFGRHRAEVVWTKESESNPGVWAAGLFLKMAEEEREAYAARLRGLAARRPDPAPA